MFEVINIMGTVIYYAIMSIVSFVINSLNTISYGMNENISITLIAIQAGLMILYFTFLPMILDNKSKEYYLGYKVSDWLIYKNLCRKWNDINVNWILNVVFIILEIICIQYKVYSVVFVIFIMFMILISKKVINYTRYITNPNIYDELIEEYFFYEIEDKKNELIDNIENNCLQDVKSFNKTIDFLLKHLDNEDVKEMFKEIYYHVMYSNNFKNVYYMYELISSNIEYQSSYDNALDFIVDDYEWYSFIKTNINDMNENRLYNIFTRIYENNLKLYNLKGAKHIRLLKNTLIAIEDSNVSEQTKEKWFSGILERIRYDMKVPSLDINSKDMFSYIDTIECCRYIIDSKDIKMLNKFYKLIDELTTFKEDMLHVMIGIYLYLIYLTEFESEEYVSKEDKDYYKDVLDKINEYMNLKGLRIYNTFSVKDVSNIFKTLSYFYMNWERMKIYVTKNINIDIAYNMLYKIFVIYSKMRYLGIENNIDDIELDIFKNTMENDKFYEHIEKSILEISSKLNIPITKEVLDEYAKNITAYATNKYKKENLISREEYNKQLDRIKELENSSNTILSKIELFKNDEFKTKSRITFENKRIIPNNDLRANIDYLLEEPDELKIILESKICNVLASKIDEKVEYNFKGEKLLEELKRLSNKEEYVYLTYENDNYGKEYMLGKEYTDVISNYKVVHTSIQKAKLILSKLEVKFNSVNIDLVELNDSEIEEEIKNYKIGEDKYMFNNSNYGYYIEFNEEEIKEFVKRNFVNIKINYLVEFGDYQDLDGCVLLYDFNS